MQSEELKDIKIKVSSAENYANHFLQSNYKQYPFLKVLAEDDETNRMAAASMPNLENKNINEDALGQWNTAIMDHEVAMQTLLDHANGVNNEKMQILVDNFADSLQFLVRAIEQENDYIKENPEIYYGDHEYKPRRLSRVIDNIIEYYPHLNVISNLKTPLEVENRRYN